jgi:hypothetical protein
MTNPVRLPESKSPISDAVTIGFASQADNHCAACWSRLRCQWILS